MTEEDILSCSDRYYQISTTQINWGKGKSQGKRSGGMIKGGMGNAPVGMQTYTGVSFEKLPDFENVKSDFKYMRGSEASRYLKARDYGLNHRESKLFSLGMKYLEKELAMKGEEAQ
jgi:hypothetical protein